MTDSDPVRVLVADDVPERAEMLVRALTENGCAVVDLSPAGPSLPNRVIESEPDVILINVDSPSRDTLEQLTMLNSRCPRPVVMFASDEARDTIEAAVHAGVSAYVTSGLGQTRVRAIIDVAIARFQQYQQLKEQLQTTRATLEERVLVDRAKGLIMKQRRCSEDEAYRWLRKTAMDRKQRIGEVAAEVIDAAGLPATARSRPS